MRKCEHKTACAVWSDDQESVIAYACVDCGARGVRPLGPSNDEPEAVRVDMRAAELEHREEWAPISWDEAHGMNIHSGFARGNSPMSSGHYSGFIARELSTHDDRETRDASAWPWDPARPVAGQWEAATQAVTRFMDGDADAMREYVAGADPAIEIGGGAASVRPGNANCPRHPTANRHAGAGECYVCYGERMAEAAAEEDKLRDPEAMRRNVEAMARKAKATNALVDDLNARGPAYHAINDAFDEADELDRHDTSFDKHTDAAFKCNCGVGEHQPPDADDDEHHDADVDARFDVTDEILPDEVAK